MKHSLPSENIVVNYKLLQPRRNQLDMRKKCMTGNLETKYRDCNSRPQQRKCRVHKTPLPEKKHRREAMSAVSRS